MSSRGRGWAAGLAAATAAGGALAASRRRTRARTGGPAAEPHISPDTAGFREGTGSPLLLLHGFSATWRAWNPILPLLVPHHDVIAPTLLGHSGADPLADDVAPSVAALVDGVEAELDRLGLGRVHVVGNSLGGWIALELARRGRARSVVALAPGGAWDSTLRIARALASLRVMLYLTEHHSTRLETLVSRDRIRHAMLHGFIARPELVNAETFIADLRSIRNATVLLPLLRVITEQPMRPLLDPGCPVRVVWGLQDRLIPFEHFGRPMVERIPSAEVVLLDRTGHVPMWDDPERVSKLILDLTGRVDRAGSGSRPDVGRAG